MGCLAHRLTSVVMAFALSGSPAVLMACTALCPDSRMGSSGDADGALAGHVGHGAVAQPAAVSPHAHHGTATSTQLAASLASASLLAPSDARLVGSCDNCCVSGPVAFAAGPGVERTDGKAFATVSAVSVAFQVIAAMHAAAPPSPPVPPPSPPRAPLALRI